MGQKPIEVEESSGCIFCDIGIEPIKMKRQYVHYLSKKGKMIICPLKGIKPMSDSSKRGVSHTPNVKPNG